MEIYGQLTAGDGNTFQDIGAIRLPFEVDTNLLTKLLMLLVVAVAVLLFIVEWVRVDVVAIAMMVMLPELGLLNSKDTFRGVSSNAVIAIIGVMIISYGLNRAGLVSRMIQPMLKYVGKSSRRMTVLFSGMIAVISSVMQNTGAAVLFLPAIRLVTSYRLKIPISRVLMPIGMAAILGGTLTMIGTSPLILLNDILPAGMPRFGFLELTPVGLGLVIGGVAYLSTIGMRTLDKLPSSQPDDRNGDANGAQEGILDAYPLLKGPFEILYARGLPTGLAPPGGGGNSPELYGKHRGFGQVRRSMPNRAPSRNQYPAGLHHLCLWPHQGRPKIRQGLRPGPESRTGMFQGQHVQSFPGRNR